MTLPRSGFMAGGGGAGGGSGDVTGPGSSTDNALVRFDGATGKVLQNSVGILSDLGALSGITLDAGVITSGTLAHERGGLESDVSAFNGLLRISGGATSSVALPLTHENGGLETDVSAYSGLLKISGGATSQAVAGTDYATINDAHTVWSSGRRAVTNYRQSPGLSFGALGTTADNTPDTIWYIPFDAGATAGTIARIRFDITAKGAGNPTVRVNLYASDGTWGNPGTRILGSDLTVSVTATGVYSLVAGGPTVGPGLFWVSVSHDTATSTLTWRAKQATFAGDQAPSHTDAFETTLTTWYGSSTYGAHPDPAATLERASASGMLRAIEVLFFDS